MQVATTSWGHGESLRPRPERPYQFWPTTNTEHSIGFPEEIILVGAPRKAKLLTHGLVSCHAVALGAKAEDGNATLHLLHNYADKSEITQERIQKARAFMAATRFELVFAAALGPSDEALEDQRLDPQEFSFAAGVYADLEALFADTDVTLAQHLYKQSKQPNSFILNYDPNAEDEFSVNHFARIPEKCGIIAVDESTRATVLPSLPPGVPGF